MTANFIALIVVLAIAIVVCFLCVRRWKTLHRPKYGTPRRVIERIVLAILVVASVAVLASTAVNAFATHHFWATHPVPGKIYRVNGYNMRIDCTGAGSPTIVMDAGLGNDGLIWGKVQPTLSKTTRVCSYDRAGFGWSDPQHGPQDANHIADQLHGLLNAAGIDGPTVLMGHSISGIYIRAYASRYPQNIVGLIFVDGSTPLQQDRWPADLQAYINKIENNTLQNDAAKILIPLGMLRDQGQCSQIPPGFSATAGKMLAEDNCEPKIAAVQAEMKTFRQSGKETIHTGPYGDLPILIFSQDPNNPTHLIPAKLAKEMSATWNGMQEDLKHLSTRSRGIIAKGSTHYIQLDRADLIDREVPLFIEQIRGTAPQPTDYGTTKTE